MYDHQWGMPGEGWGPQSSFIVPLTPLADAPGDAPLVQLPCINANWLAILRGCIDQLANPATWDAAAGDFSIATILDHVDALKAMMSDSNVPCCNVEMRFTSACGLQFSTDGGSTWNDVTGWNTYFQTCVQAQIIAPIPPNPGGSTVQQHACNIAGYLANEIVKVAMEKVVAYVGTTTEQLQFAKDVLNTIGYAFPITYAATNAFVDWYNSVVSQILSEVEAARDDPALWSAVTCAIYQAIKGAGYVNASNYSAAHANIAALTYTYSWVIPVVAQWWIDMGLTNIQQAQNVGAMDDVDCTNCGNWCLQDNIYSGMNGWSLYDGFATYVLGTGWKSQYDPPLNREDVGIKKSLAAATTINHVDFWVETIAGSQPMGTYYVFLFHGGSSVASQSGAGVAGSAGLWHFAATFANILCDEIVLYWVNSTLATQVAIQYATYGGPGPNPFGADDCTPTIP
jgi:hypothetical protein